MLNKRLYNGERMKNYIVKENEVGIRVDKLICTIDKNISRVAVQRMIEKRKYISE